MVDLRCIVSGYQSEWRRDGYMNCCAPKGKLMDKITTTIYWNLFESKVGRTLRD